MQACKGAVASRGPGLQVWIREQLGDHFLSSFIYSCPLDEASLLNRARTQVTQAWLLGHELEGGAHSQGCESVGLVPGNDCRLRFHAQGAPLASSMFWPCFYRPSSVQGVRNPKVNQTGSLIPVSSLPGKSMKGEGKPREG